jgi:hypothetical protein
LGVGTRLVGMRLCLLGQGRDGVEGLLRGGSCASSECSFRCKSGDKGNWRLADVSDGHEHPNNRRTAIRGSWIRPFSEAVNVKGTLLLGEKIRFGSSEIGRTCCTLA